MVGKIAIIGSGQAGAQVAISLRQKGFEGSLLIIGDETFPPYQRPPLSKAYLKNEQTADQLLLRPVEFWQMQNVDLITRCSVEKINPKEKSISLTNQKNISYDKLIIATGSRARKLPDISAPTVHTLRSLADVDHLKKVYQSAHRLTILGAGYIGLEVAASMRKQNVDVCVIEAQPRILQRVVSEEVSTFFETLHRDNAVDLRTNCFCDEVIAGNDGVKIKLKNNTIIDSDALLIAIGASPATELAANAGLNTDDGIIVNEMGQTSHPDIFAAGDCTRFYSQRYQRNIRLESVQNAIDQAKIVAGTIMGHLSDYNPVPWFWSDQYDVKLQIAGLSQNYNKTTISGDPKDKKFSISYFQNERLLAVDAINQPKEHMLARRQLATN